MTKEEIVLDNLENEDSGLNSLEKKLLKTTWVKEAEMILDFVPHEDLTKTQIKTLEKCINKEELTDKQLVDLKKVLQKYRPALQKLKPSKTVEEFEDVVQMIQTEKDFIELMQTDEHKRLLVHINVDGQKIGFDFEVLPLNDSRVVDALELNIDLFKDYSLEEINTYNKFAKGEEISREESIIIAKMNNEITSKQSAKRIVAMNEFLAYQLKVAGSNATLDERRKFWEVFPFNAKASVFLRVQDMLGMSEQSNKELFPTR